MTTTMTDAEARAARVAAGGAYLDVREPGWLHRIDLGKLDLHAPCKCVLGQLAIDKHGDLGGWTWSGICSVFSISIFDPAAGQSDYDLGFNASWPLGNEVAPLAQYTALTAEWVRYIEQRRATS